MKSTSPRCIIEVHPTLIHRDAFLKDLCNMFKNTDVKGNYYTEKWIKTQHPEWNAEIEPTLMLYFIVIIGMRKFENEAKHINMPAIHLECAGQD
eukprot:9196328-Ditylum_brightwellii.AAC.1